RTRGCLRAWPRPGNAMPRPRFSATRRAMWTIRPHSSDCLPRALLVGAVLVARPGIARLHLARRDEDDQHEQRRRADRYAMRYGDRQRRCHRLPILPMLMVLLIAATTVFGASDFGTPTPGQHVYDTAGVLTPAETQALERRAADLAASGTPVVVYLRVQDAS